MNEVFLTREEIEHPYANLVVMLEDKRKKAEQMSNTVFCRITSSPEVLAHYLVRLTCFHHPDGSADLLFASAIIEGRWSDRAEAIAATVARLKEVAE